MQDVRRFSPSIVCVRVALAFAAAVTSSLADAAGTRDRDEIVLVSTRAVGMRCDAELVAARIECRRYAAEQQAGTRNWQKVDLATALPAQTDLPTIVYIHGNRVEANEASAHGLRIYHSMDRQLPDVPVRFVIWSWPAEQVRGVVKDYRVKAARTGPVAWQTAWALNRLPADLPLAIVGYSYGARVATGALHLLGGGTLDGRSIDDLQPHRRKVHAILLAAALDADWLQPGGYHGRALNQVERLSLVTNRRDPAMRFYHLTTDRSTRALGYAGPTALGSILNRFDVEVKAFDATGDVGRHHALQAYLGSSPQLTQAWRGLASLQLPTPPANASELRIVTTGEGDPSG